MASPRTVKARNIVFYAIMAALFIGGDAMAQQSKSIAAVVNDDVISIFDLNERLSLVMASSQGQNDPEVRKRLAPQVLRVLIDEKLKLQEAKRLNVSVAEEEIERALRTMEERNNLPPGGLDNFLKIAGVNKAAMVSQIEAELVWTKVIGYTYASTIQITDEEVDEKLAESRAMAEKPELQVAEILLPVNSPEDEHETQLLANRLTKQIKNGTSFQALARSFSQSPSASNGGELGWINQGLLGSKLDAALAKLNPGEVTDPIRTLEGYYILFLHGRRDAQTQKPEEENSVTISLQQIFFLLPKKPSDQDVASQMELAGTMSQMATDCPEMDALGKELGSPLSGNLGDVQVSKLPQNIKEVVANLPIGKSSRPFRSKKGILIVMVCAREGGDQVNQDGTLPQGQANNAPDSDERLNIKGMLMGMRLQAAARRLLRDLRNTAFMDIRI